MAFLHRLENFLSRFAIPGLIRYIAILNALVFILIKLTPGYASILALDPQKVLQGEVWRLASYIFIPETGSYIFIIFAVMFLWFVGEQLEAAWGTFRLNLFYFSGMIFTTIAAFFFGGAGTGTYLNLSLLLAFATLFPDTQILLYFIPVKAKWLGWIAVAFLVWGSLSFPLYAKAGILISLCNYFLFFGPAFIRAQMQRGKVAVRRNQFKQDSIPDEEAMHRCPVCGRTNLSHPDLEFRVAEDGEDYCQDHLPNKNPGITIG
ncbi:MAG: rhomboid family intramembrane serine protease [Chthoniobacterales bacterium]